MVPDSGMALTAERSGFVVMSWRPPAVQLPTVGGSLAPFTLNTTEYQVSFALSFTGQVNKDFIFIYLRMHYVCVIRMTSHPLRKSITHFLSLTPPAGERVEDWRRRVGHGVGGECEGSALCVAAAIVGCHVSHTWFSLFLFAHRKRHILSYQYS